MNLWPGDSSQRVLTQKNGADFDQKTTEHATKPVENVGTEQAAVEQNVSPHPQKPPHQQKQNKQKPILSSSSQNKHI